MLSLGRAARSPGARTSTAPARMSVLPRWMLSVGGLFDRTIRELPEMAYQYDRDYLFDSSRFETHFHFSPTSYEQGIRETLEYLAAQGSG